MAIGSAAIAGISLWGISLWWLVAGETEKSARPENPPPTAAPPAVALAGRTDTQSGEARRNENVQFNLVDNNAMREFRQRMGTTATIVGEFTPDRSYFGAEYGAAPSAPIHLRSGKSPRCDPRTAVLGSR